MMIELVALVIRLARVQALRCLGAADWVGVGCIGCIGWTDGGLGAGTGGGME